MGAPWESHGALRVSDNGHYLEHEDGTGFFWLGDTAWRLTSLHPDDVRRYLADRKERGFNVIQFTISGMGKPAYNGARPFIGNGKSYATAQLNEPFWKHADFVVSEAGKLGLYVAVFVWWGPDADEMFADPHTHNFEFGKKLGIRYRDTQNVIWVGSGEYHKPNRWRPPVSDEHLSNLTRVVEGIREGDAGRHLITMHPLSFLSSSDEFHDADWLDFNMVQSHFDQGYIEPLVTGDWNRTPAKPTLNSEPWYEGEEELFERRTGLLKVPTPQNRKFDSAWIQRYQAYWSVFFGGTGYTYGHMNLWMMNDVYEIYTHADWGTQGVLLLSALNAPGTANLKHIKRLMERRLLQAHMPDPELISVNSRGSCATLSPTLRCATRDVDGKWAYIYSTRGDAVRVIMSRLAPGTANASWYNPRNGLWLAGANETETQEYFETGISSGDGAEDHFFTPPR